MSYVSFYPDWFFLGRTEENKNSPSFAAQPNYLQHQRQVEPTSYQAITHRGKTLKSVVK